MPQAVVVIATDLSPAAERALDAGQRLASALEAEIVLLHVVPTVPADTLGMPTAAFQPVHEDVLTERAKARLEELRARLPESVQVSTVVVVGKEIDATIADYATQRGAAYLVVTTHGRTGVRRLVLGSVAEGIVRRASLPVVVVPM